MAGRVAPYGAPEDIPCPALMLLYNNVAELRQIDGVIATDSALISRHGR
jgi:hypothetical protein